MNFMNNGGMGNTGNGMIPVNNGLHSNMLGMPGNGPAQPGEAKLLPSSTSSVVQALQAQCWYKQPCGLPECSQTSLSMTSVRVQVSKPVVCCCVLTVSIATGSGMMPVNGMMQPPGGFNGMGVNSPFPLPGAPQQPNGAASAPRPQQQPGGMMPPAPGTQSTQANQSPR